MSTVTETKDVWVAWTNTDLTEGRGWEIPLAVCEKQATAIRLGRQRSVQGCDCKVSKATAYKINGRWVGPFRLIGPTREDDSDQNAIDAKQSAIEAAKRLGLSDEQIKALGRP